MSFSSLIAAIGRGSLVKQIIIGVVLGVLLALAWPDAAQSVGILGAFFVSALKAVAPVLVFLLIISAISSHKQDTPVYIRPILVLYVLATFMSALLAVVASFLFPTELTLKVGEVSQTPPKNISEVLQTLMMNIADNPVHALSTPNYIGILAWAIFIGICLRFSSETTKTVFSDVSDIVTQIVRWVIRIAPLGVFGAVANTVAETGFGELYKYGMILMVLIGVMLLVALVVNPALVYWKIRRNPYPLVFQCLLESGITAFFTRSSAANIPVNMALAKKLGLHEDTYSISIPLGATINMSGAAITITVLTLAAVNTLGIQVDLYTAVLLSALASVGACGASGVPGGSLLLIPMACGLFGISDDIAMQVVVVGTIINVVQDSCETALNSSSDVLFTAAADLGAQRKNG